MRTTATSRNFQSCEPNIHSPFAKLVVGICCRDGGLTDTEDEGKEYVNKWGNDVTFGVSSVSPCVGLKVQEQH